jgi:hypothetical protein
VIGQRSGPSLTVTRRIARQKILLSRTSSSKSKSTSTQLISTKPREILNASSLTWHGLPGVPPCVQVYLEVEFRDNKPNDYCPPRFSNCLTDAHFAESEDRESQQKSVAQIGAGHHKVDLALTFLMPRHEDCPDAVPSGTSYIKRASELIPATGNDSSWSDVVALSLPPLRSSGTFEENEVLAMPARDRLVQLDDHLNARAKVDEVYFDPTIGIQDQVCLRLLI